MVQKLKHYFLLFVFCSLFVALSFVSFVGGFDRYGEVQIQNQNKVRSPEDSYFKNVTFFTVANSKPTINMRAKEMVISEDFSSTVALFVDGLYYSLTNPEPIKFSAQRAVAHAKENVLDLEQKVVLYDSVHEFKAEKLRIVNKGEKIFGKIGVETTSTIKNKDGVESNVSTVTIKSNEVDYYSPTGSVVYRGMVDGKIQRLRAYEEGVKFKSAELNLDGAKGLITLLGQVYLNKGNFEVWANSGEIFLENYNKKLKYYSLSDDVRLREVFQVKMQEKERKAFAEKLEGWMNERKVILTGFPKVIQDKDIIKGNRIILRENSESVEIDDANSSLIMK